MGIITQDKQEACQDDDEISDLCFGTLINHRIIIVYCLSYSFHRAL
jgi:hypothetical protein